jgi:hypothetical protein
MMSVKQQAVMPVQPQAITSWQAYGNAQAAILLCDAQVVIKAL